MSAAGSTKPQKTRWATGTLYKTVREVTCAEALKPDLPDNAALCRSEALGLPVARRRARNLHMRWASLRACSSSCRSSPSGSSSASLSRSGPSFSKRLPLVCSSEPSPKAPTTLRRARGNASKQSRCDLQCAHTARQRAEGARCYSNADLFTSAWFSSKFWSAAAMRRVVPSSLDPPQRGDLSTVSGDAWFGWPRYLQEQTVDK